MFAYNRIFVNNKNMVQKKHGFTLIELMVVIVILGILTSIGIFAFISSQVKSRDSKRKTDLAQVAKALEMYANDNNGSYPAATNGLIRGCGTRSTAVADCVWGEPFTQNVDFSNGTSTITYMTKLPKESVSTRTYYYETVSSGYRLYARLENLEDAAILGEYDIDCGTAVDCNYVITSSNAAMPTPIP